MAHTLIPHEEIDVFKQLPDIQVVIDVGARADTDYLDLIPDVELHAFEPHPEFFEELKVKVGDRKAHLNNCGLGDLEGVWPYSDGRQAFMGGECPPSEPNRRLKIRTLDNYVKENKIKSIDFLKIDVEGYDYKVLLGSKKALKLCRFVQYEYWDNQKEFRDLLDKDFDMENIGYRNVLCMNKKLVPLHERVRLASYIHERNYQDLR